MLTIREALSRDSYSIQQLSKNLTLTPYTVDPKFKSISNNSIPLLANQQCSNKNIKIFVAEKNNKIIGYISLIIEKEFSYFIAQRCASILFLVVDTSFQNQGVGGLLLDHAIQYCQQQRSTIIRVGTDEHNHALHLYQKKGFNQVLVWDIHRIYRHELNKNIQKIPLYKMDSNIEKFPMNAILKRPLVWLYYPPISVEGVHKFLIKQFINKFNQKEISWWTTSSQESSVIIKRDKLREKYYGIAGTLWVFNDLYYQDKLQAEIFLKNLVFQLPQLFMAEYWVCRHDKETKQLLENVGFQKVYSGYSLILKLN